MGAVTCCPSEGKAGSTNRARKGGVGRTKVQQGRTGGPFFPSAPSSPPGAQAGLCARSTFLVTPLVSPVSVSVLNQRETECNGENLVHWHSSAGSAGFLGMENLSAETD